MTFGRRHCGGWNMSGRARHGLGAVAVVLLGVGLSAAPYPVIPPREVATTKRTHVCTVGPVVYARRQADGDWHITLDDGTSKVVAEIIPQIPMPAPAKGQRIEVCGITRFDGWHKWHELHPVLSWARK